MQDSYKDLLARVEKLEKAVFGDKEQVRLQYSSNKTISLAELARSKELADANGQQKVAAIVGYYEKLKNEGSSRPEKIKAGWIKGKFQGKYNPVFVHRAVGTLIRDRENGTYDLTQAGERSFGSVYHEQ